MQSEGELRESVDGKASVLPQLLSKALATVGFLLGGERDRRVAEMSHFDESYNLLFCDDLNLFRHVYRASAGEPWATLLSESADVAALRQIAESDSEHSRARALAYRRLRSAGVDSAKSVLGFIVEVPVEGGLDVLAAYSDGRVAYLHQTGATVAIENPSPQVVALTTNLTRSGYEIVDKVGALDRKRSPSRRRKDSPDLRRVGRTLLLRGLICGVAGRHACGPAAAECDRTARVGYRVRLR